MALFTVAGWFASISHVAELTTHFKVFYFLGALVAAGLLASRRQWRWCAFAIVLAGVHVPGLATWYLPAAKPTAESGATLRILTANVLTENRNHERFIEFVRESDPDILFVQETDRAWVESLEALADTYPFQVVEPRSDNFGMALFSRVPLEDIQIFHQPETNVPAIHAQLTLGGRTVRILCFHAVPPGSREWTTMRNAQLAWIPEYVAEQDGPVIIAGDFNVTPWSPHYKNIIRASGLIASRKGHGIAATWPRFPFPLLPLDHILTSPDIHTRAFRRGPRLGSDHRPLVADLVLPL